MSDTDDVPEIAACACLAIRQSARKVTRLYDEALAPSGLKVTQFSLLNAIDRVPELSVNRLADILSIDRTTMVRNLKVLQKDGLVHIAKAEADNRRRELSLTERGEAMLAEARPLWAAVQAQLVDRMGEARYDALKSGLAALAEAAAPEEEGEGDETADGSGAAGL
jgi:DNA-binding MarR family transcriptional regulator